MTDTTISQMIHDFFALARTNASEAECRALDARIGAQIAATPEPELPESALAWRRWTEWASCINRSDPDLRISIELCRRTKRAAETELGIIKDSQS